LTKECRTGGGRLELVANTDSNTDGLLDEYIGPFLEDCRLQGLTQYSIHTYASILRDFRRHLISLGIADIGDMNKDAVREYIRVLREDRKLRIPTIENCLSCVSSLCEYLVFEGVLNENIVLPVRRRYVRRLMAERPNDYSRRKLVTTAQIKTLIDSVLIPRDRAIIMLLAKTGVRRGELVTIDGNDVDLASMRIILKPKPKRSNRVVLFDEECLRLLRD
jgi:integrase/recombinase XerD